MRSPVGGEGVLIELVLTGTKLKTSVTLDAAALDRARQLEIKVASALG